MGDGLEVLVETVDRAVTVWISGELDMATVDQLGVVGTAINAGPDSVVIDIAGLEFVDSRGIRELLILKVTAELKGIHWAMANATPAVRRSLTTMGVIETLNVE